MEEFDPEAKDMLMQLMGQTYGELHKLDKFIVSPSQQLRPKSEEFKQTVANVTKTLNEGLTQRVPQQVMTHQNVTIPVPVVQHVAVDPNQLEFGFDNSATAVSIDKALARLEDKIDRLSNTLNRVLERSKK